jgi:HSP20 family protein
MAYDDDWQRQVERYLEHFARSGKRPTIVFTQQAQLEPVWTPAVDMYETRDAVVVVLELAGVEPDQCEVQAEPHRLVVRGTRRERRAAGGDQGGRRTYHALEIRYGRFERALPLPPTVDGTGSTATYRDGLLEISLPKRQPARVRIKVDEEGQA